MVPEVDQDDDELRMRGAPGGLVRAREREERASLAHIDRQAGNAHAFKRLSTNHGMVS